MTTGYRARTARMMTWMAVALLLAGCGSAYTLHEAQDAFNAAAWMEHEQAVPAGGPRDADPMLSGEAVVADEPRVHYAAALVILRGITDDKPLAADGLLATKLAMEAWCLWKLGRVDDAMRVQQQGLTAIDAATSVNDAAMLRVLPALVIIERTRAIVKRDGEPLALDEVRRDLFDADRGAARHIREARQGAVERPVDAYLVQVELSMWQLFTEARRLHNVERTDAENASIQSLFADLRRLGESLRIDPNRIDAIIAHWTTALAVGEQ